MSRIGNALIEIPKGVEIKVSPGNVVSVKGPKGELEEKIDPRIKVNINENVVTFERSTDAPQDRSMHGLYRSLVNNMVVGVSEGFKTIQELHGVGYRADAKGQRLELALGYSHPIVFELPLDIKVTTETVKGQPPTIIMESHDKQLLGMVAAKIRSFRKPEPYKGKGIRFKGEQIRRKAGKTSSK